MEITGKIIAILEERSGTSSSGREWRVQSYLLETLENTQYNQPKMQFDVWGSDRIAAMNIQQGMIYKISFDIDAREYNGRWFNTIRAWKAELITQSSAPTVSQPITEHHVTMNKINPPASVTSVDDGSDLPF